MCGSQETSVTSIKTSWIFCFTWCHFLFVVLIMQIWCESIYAIEGTLHSRPCLYQFFPCGKLTFDLIFSPAVGVWWAYILFIFTFFCLMIDKKHGWKYAIIQAWWSLLVYWSHNSRCHVHSSSFDCIVILDNSRGEHFLFKNFSFNFHFNSLSRLMFWILAWMFVWSYFSVLNFIPSVHYKTSHFIRHENIVLNWVGESGVICYILVPI